LERKQVDPSKTLDIHENHPSTYFVWSDSYRLHSVFNSEV